MPELKKLEIKNFFSESERNIVSDGSSNQHLIISGSVDMYSQNENDLRWHQDGYLLTGWKPIITRNFSPTSSYPLVNYCHTGRISASAIQTAVVNARGQVYLISHLYSPTDKQILSSVASIGSPTSVTTNRFVTIAYGGKLYWGSAGSNNIYAYDFNTSSWSVFSSQNIIVHLMTFGKYLYALYDLGSTIAVLDSSGSLVGTLSIPFDKRGTKMVNINNRYVGILISNSTSPYYGYMHSFWIWDGNPFSAVAQQIDFVEKVLDVVVYQGSVLFFVETPNGFAIKQLYGNSLNTVATIEKGLKIPAGWSSSDVNDNPGYAAFNKVSVSGDYLIIPTERALVVYNPKNGQFFRREWNTIRKLYVSFIHSDKTNFVWADPSQPNNFYVQSLFGLKSDEETIYPPFTYIEPLIKPGTSYSFGSLDFHYVSNWFSLAKRIRLLKAEVYMLDNDQTSTDELKMTVHYVDEDRLIGSTSSSQSFVLQSYLVDNQRYKKQVHLGIECNSFKIEFSIDSNKNWSGFIKRVIIYYEVLE